MASYNELLALIDAYINRNGVQAITGQILNGVLKAMVDQLGRGYTLMGYAEPTGDPGTPDGPESWFASVPGTYTNYGEIQVAAGELALLSFAPSEGWTKNTIYEGFREVTATADDNIGFPQVGVTYENGVLSFDFKNIKGEPGENGDPAGFGAVTASVDDQVGTPSVSVSSSGPGTAKNFAFAFHNLKGETGVTSVVATVDNASGNPQCSVSLQGGQLTLAFTGLKGAQGNTGSSVDYPFTIVNNLTTDDPTQALSAAMGVELDGKVSQLEAEVTDLDVQLNGNPSVSETIDEATTSGTAISYVPTALPAVLKAGRKYHIKVEGIGTLVSSVTFYVIDDSNNGVPCDWGGFTTQQVQRSFTTSTIEDDCTPTNDASKYALFTGSGNVIGSGTLHIIITSPAGEGLGDTVISLEHDVQDNQVKIKELSFKKVETKTGKNLYNPETDEPGMVILSDGQIQGNNSYRVSDFIPVEEGSYYFSALYNGIVYPVFSSGAYVNLYDEDFELISTINDSPIVTIPSGIKYLRTSVLGYVTNVQIEKGNTRSDYEPYNPIRGYINEFGAEIIAIDEKKLDKKLGKNLLDVSSAISGKYINTSGVLANNPAYSVSDYIPVIEGNEYCFTGMNGQKVSALGTSSACANYYDSLKELVSTVTGADLTRQIPSGVSFIRVSIINTLTDVQIEHGTTRTSYEPYNPMSGYNVSVADNSVSFSKLTQEVNDAIAKPFASARTSGTLDASETLLMDKKFHIIKNSMVVAKIHGTIDSVLVGVGVVDTLAYDYYAHWIEVTQTQAKLYWYNNVNEILLATYNHGITLTQNTTVEVLTTVDGSQVSLLKIYDDLGNIFTQELPEWGVGFAFARNNNTSGQIDVDLSFMPMDITKKVWVFGDSYMYFTANTRWPYYLVPDKLTRWLANHQPGLSPTNAYADLVSLLTFGYIPTYLVWTLGMNGDTVESLVDGQYVINNAQKTVLDNVLALCEQYGIIPILSTIPTVPARQKTGFCNYVRNLGVRYIDFAEAVGADSSGNWNTGLLSADEVHPSVAGGKVLASRVLLDCPELAIVE